jgi:short-subunit dehydrogenase
VTGASSGIGAAFAERLARDQYDLILVARRQERLETLAQRLHDDHHATVTAIVADLTQPSDLQVVESHVANDSALTLLVNNAGFGGYMPFVALEPDRAEELIRL